MPKVRYVQRAYADLDEMTAFSINKWGIAQTEDYLDDLHERCLVLASYPRLGRVLGPVRPKWRRFEHESHVVLYSITRSGITVHRILHTGQLLPATTR